MRSKHHLLDCSSYKDVLYLKYMDEKGKVREQRLYGYEWYFYILLEDVDKFKKYLPINAYTKVVPGNAYAKVYMDYWEAKTRWLEMLMNSQIKTFEGDLSPEDRWKYDNNITIDSRVNVLYIDIETDDKNPVIDIGRDFILSFSAKDKKGQEYYYELEEMTPQAEEHLMWQIHDLLKKYLIVSGWNINDFDIPYLRARMARYDLKFPRLGYFDLFERIKHIYRNDTEIKSYSLENVSQIFLKRGKVKHTEKIHQLWQNNKPLLKEYNCEDTNLCFDLDEKLQVTNMMLKMCEWCNVYPRKFSIYQLIDSVIIQQSHSMQRPVPTNYKTLRKFGVEQVKDENDLIKYMGAEVLEPKVGLHKNVTVFDFKSLYPSIIQTFNISWDALTYMPKQDSIQAPGPATIVRDSSDQVRPTYFDPTDGAVTNTIHLLLYKRKEYKDLKLKFIEEGKTETPEYQKVASDELVVKELSNAVYGIMGMQFGRYFNPDIAESITLSGRWILFFTKDFFNSRGFEVIYGDTDSIFVKNLEEHQKEPELEKFHEAIIKVMTETYKIRKNFIQLNFDKHYTNFILFAKKTYAGHCDNMEGKKVDKLFVRGVEYIKRSTFKWAAVRQKELIDDIVRGKLAKFEIPARIQKYKNEFFTSEFKIEDLKLTQRVGQENYKGNPLIAKLANHVYRSTGIHPVGTELSFIITSWRSGLKGCLIQDYTGRFSREYYWENMSRPLLDKVLNCIFPANINIDYHQLFPLEVLDDLTKPKSEET